MTRLAWFAFFIGLALAADRNTVIIDPAASREFKARYVALTDSWERATEFSPAEEAAMQAGKKWEALMMQGPDDPLAKKILAAGEPSRSEEHTSELQSPYVISYAVFCLKKR